MRAIILLSGGLDSTTSLYAARRDRLEPAALTFSYGQRHGRELDSARKIASHLKLEHWIVPLSLPWGGSALTDSKISIPKGRPESEMSREIPATYVPARNSIFLALAVSLAETQKAEFIYFGANALDYSGYPDCRPEFIEAFENVILRGTRVGARHAAPLQTRLKSPIRIRAPLLRMGKGEIVRLAHELGVPFERTWSCYEGGEAPCGECDSCVLRAKGFREAGISDPLVNQFSGHCEEAGGRRSPDANAETGVRTHEDSFNRPFLRKGRSNLKSEIASVPPGGETSQ